MQRRARRLRRLARGSRPLGGVVLPCAVRLICAVCLLIALSQTAAIASPARTPLTIAGRAALAADGSHVTVDVDLAGPDGLQDVRVAIDVTPGDQVRVTGGALAAAGSMSVEALGVEEQRFNADLRVTRRITLVVVPARPGNHRVDVRVLAERPDGNTWADMYSYFYNLENGVLVEGWVRTEGPEVTRARRFEGTLPEPTGATPLRPVPTAPPTTASLPTGAASAPAPGAAATTGTVVVSGRFYLYDQTSMLIPQIERLVKLVNASNTVLATAYTNLQGYYQFPAVTNPGALRVEVWCQADYVREGGTDQVKTIDSNGIVHHVSTDLETGVPDGNYFFGEWIVGFENDLLKGFWAFNTEQATYRYFYLIRGDGTEYPGGIVAVWYPGSTNGNYFRPGVIYLTDIAPWSKDIVAHEAGHSVMYHAYKSWLPDNDCPAPREINQNTTVRCAWVEGWADFTALVVNGDSVLAGASGDAVDLEPPTWWTPDWDTGMRVEGHVAGALWDIVDAANEPAHDHHTDPIAAIWHTLWQVKDEDVCNFWKDSQNYGIKRSRDNELYQNTIDECRYCFEDPYEPDDSCAAATREGPGSTYTYNHCGSADWQYVLVSPDWVYTWETDDLGYLGDTTLTLYASDCTNELGFNDDKFDGKWPKASRLVWTSDRNDVVYISTREYQDAYGPYRSYDISLSAVCPVPPPADGLNPPQSGLTCSSPVVITWTGHARTYDVWLDGQLVCAGTTATSCTTGGLATGWHSYYVESRNACGGASLSPTIYFWEGAGTVPQSTPALHFTSVDRLEWTQLFDVLSYDLVRGNLTLLRRSRGDFREATEECLENNGTSVAVTYTPVPRPRDGFYFVARGVGCGGNGTYDSQSPSQSGSRDAEINATGLCP